MNGIPPVELWRIFRRHWLLLILLPAITLLLSERAARLNPSPQTWQVALAYAVEVPASAAVPGSEYGTRAEVAADLVDDLARIIGRDVFAEALNRRLPEGRRLEVGEITASLSSDDQHRILDLRISRDLPGSASPAERSALQTELSGLAAAIMIELEEEGPRWLGMLGEEGARLSLIDRPDPAAPLAPGLRQRLEIPLRVGLAGLLALGLASLLESLDPRLRREAEVETLCGASILGRIPRS